MSLTNLKISVDVDVGQALTNLSRLQEKLHDVGQQVRRLDGKEIRIETDIESIKEELLNLKRQIKGFEMANDIDLRADTALSQAAAASVTKAVMIVGRVPTITTRSGMSAAKRL